MGVYSRNPVETGSPFVHITAGNDHAVGPYIQVQDDRYTWSGQDEQGEGYVLDYDSLFGFTTNLIGATRDDLSDAAKLTALCDKFADTLKPKI